MSILNLLFGKKRSRENVEAHVVVEQKNKEAVNVLNEVTGKLVQVTGELEKERVRSNNEMRQKIKEINDVAKKIAVATGGYERGRLTL